MCLIKLHLIIQKIDQRVALNSLDNSRPKLTLQHVFTARTLRRQRQQPVLSTCKSHGQICPLDKPTPAYASIPISDHICTPTPRILVSHLCIQVGWIFKDAFHILWHAVHPVVTTLCNQVTLTSKSAHYGIQFLSCCLACLLSILNRSVCRHLWAWMRG